MTSRMSRSGRRRRVAVTVGDWPPAAQFSLPRRTEGLAPHRLAQSVDALAGLAEEIERRFDRRAVVGEVGPALVGDGVELLVALGRRGDVAGLLEEGQRRIDDARARRIEALRLFLDGLDQVVAVARLLLDEVQRDQPQVAAGQHAADAEIAAEAVPVAELPRPGIPPKPRRAIASKRRQSRSQR